MSKYGEVDNNGISVQSAHFQWLKNNQSRCIEKIDKSISSFSNKNCVKDFSAKSGMFNGYSGWFTQVFVDKELKQRNDVDIVEEDCIMTIQHVIRRDAQLQPPEGLDRIDQAKFPLDGQYIFPNTAGQGVNIFIVDTGVRITHQEFEGRATFGGSFCAGCNNQDENGHGTNVAAIAAGKTFGVAKKANIIAIGVLGANGGGAVSGILNGLSFIQDNHTSGNNKNSVVNMSLGGNFSTAFNTAVQKLTVAGIHVVVAAGNNGKDACQTSPASEPSAITVGATEDTSDDLTNFSNFGKCVDIYAPGRNVEGAGINNNTDTSIKSGTSQATPHVAGTLALIIAKNGNQSPAAMAKTLSNLSTKGVIIFSGNAANTSINNFLRVPAP
ncbi:16011_t:CDS:2 [Dentiscutata erythropus]|uniref:16011_t:CDS:1 n=1 Tax=Dentiscutata erythropus TaxID=1348616 RepID=A0A9N8WGV1_9GLOM|nr:16011_t:CDS:2 [Dentiscutata erythropus]